MSSGLVANTCSYLAPGFEEVPKARQCNFGCFAGSDAKSAFLLDRAVTRGRTFCAPSNVLTLGQVANGCSVLTKRSTDYFLINHFLLLSRRSSTNRSMGWSCLCGGCRCPMESLSSGTLVVCVLSFSGTRQPGTCRRSRNALSALYLLLVLPGTPCTCSRCACSRVAGSWFCGHRIYGSGTGSGSPWNLFRLRVKRAKVGVVFPRAAPHGCHFYFRNSPVCLVRTHFIPATVPAHPAGYLGESHSDIYEFGFGIFPAPFAARTFHRPALRSASLRVRSSEARLAAA